MHHLASYLEQNMTYHRSVCQWCNNIKAEAPTIYTREQLVESQIVSILMLHHAHKSPHIPMKSIQGCVFFKIGPPFHPQRCQHSCTGLHVLVPNKYTPDPAATQKYRWSKPDQGHACMNATGPKIFHHFSFLSPLLHAAVCMLLGSSMLLAQTITWPHHHVLWIVNQG